MTKLPRDHRQMLMLNKHELAEIDQWRYDNHIPTRAKAIRLLCLHGKKNAETMEREVMQRLLDHINEYDADLADQILEESLADRPHQGTA